MNAFTQANLAVAAQRLENAMAHLEHFVDSKDPVVIGEAYREMLRARGALHAAMRIEEMAEEATLIEAARAS